MSQSYGTDGYEAAVEIYIHGGREAVARMLARYARHTTWEKLIHAENMCVLAMEALRSSLVARLDQLEAGVAECHGSIAAELLRAEAEELRVEIDRRDAEIESIVSASLGRFEEDPGSGNVPLR